MCLFPKRSPVGSKIDRYDCGTCPECLSKRAKQWALRCCMEAKDNIGMMMTLTYDNYIRDGRGNIIGEQVDTRPVSKRDCQLFIKRLRKHFSGVPLKYLITAEYGNRTHRSHYHCLIFGIQFDDLIYYKRSKRGNIIYKSKTLENIWHNGICTVDSININACTARYCTKYCAKDGRSDDTFMLFSRGIGENRLLSEFNGISYYVDGREYPIPRLIWRKVIEERYRLDSSYRYISYKDCYDKVLMLFVSRDFSELYNAFDSNMFLTYERESRVRFLRDGSLFDETVAYYTELECGANKAIELNKVYSSFKKNGKIPCKYLYRLAELYYFYRKDRLHKYYFYRDNDTQYQQYIDYWSDKIAKLEETRPSEFERILALPNERYFTYKQKALANYHNPLKTVCPRSRATFLYKWTLDYKSFGALSPLVIKRQMTPKKTQYTKNNIKTAFYLRKIDKILYLREKKSLKYNPFA